jgi:hypothetical protein
MATAPANAPSLGAGGADGERGGGGGEDAGEDVRSVVTMPDSRSVRR